MSAKGNRIDYSLNENMLNNFPFGLIILNAEKKIEQINHHAIRYMRMELDGPVTGQALSDFISMDMVELVWQQRKVYYRMEKLVTNGEKVYFTYSPILDQKGLTIKTLITIEPYDTFIEKIREQTDYYPMTELIPLIAEYSPDAVSFVVPNSKKTYYNNKWNLLIERMCKHDEGAQDELEHILNRIVKDTIKQRRKIEQVVSMSSNLEIEITSKPIIISGKLYGCFQMIRDDKELNKYKRQYRLATSVIRNLEKTYLFDDMIGNSFDLIMAKKQAKLYANMNVPIFLRGEQGTGKELMARALHYDTDRKEYPFKHLRIDGKEENLETFIFNDATSKGILSEVRGGTLFIEECTNFPKKILNRIVHELEENSSGQSFQLIVSSSNLEDSLPRSTFYDWISRYQIVLPPLRERREDLALLVSCFMEQCNMKFKTNLQTIDGKMLELFGKYSWPKNISELKHIVELTAISAGITNKILTKDLLPEHFLANIEKKSSTYSGDLELQQALDSFERDYIENTLETNQYNKTKTAKKLGISIRNLYYKMDKYNIDRGSS
ncbi:helix-turn-helix domain-containing protein [Gracilibacillus xinjiangensis]|uniref:Helix-turn-helix domain-containing protein n=1 Tax=Gracilibacillus xinjiangensis TaxID=1193282 RepID=A0ABV8WYA2_9BACI